MSGRLPENGDPVNECPPLPSVMEPPITDPSNDPVNDILAKGANMVPYTMP
ncbi:hypothetical protein D3C73_1498440 [compost metagenome]